MPTSQSDKYQLPKGINEPGLKSDDELAAERKFVTSKPGKRYANAQWGEFKALRKGKTRKAAKYSKKISKYHS